MSSALSIYGGLESAETLQDFLGWLRGMTPDIYTEQRYPDVAVFTVDDAIQIISKAFHSHCSDAVNVSLQRKVDDALISYRSLVLKRKWRKSIFKLTELSELNFG